MGDVALGVGDGGAAAKHIVAGDDLVPQAVGRRDDPSILVVALRIRHALGANTRLQPPQVIVDAGAGITSRIGLAGAVAQGIIVAHGDDRNVVQSARGGDHPSVGVVAELGQMAQRVFGSAALAKRPSVAVVGCDCAQVGIRRGWREAAILLVLNGRAIPVGDVDDGPVGIVVDGQAGLVQGVGGGNLVSGRTAITTPVSLTRELVLLGYRVQTGSLKGKYSSSNDINSLTCSYSKSKV